MSQRLAGSLHPQGTGAAAITDAQGGAIAVITEDLARNREAVLATADGIANLMGSKGLPAGQDVDRLQEARLARGIGTNYQIDAGCRLQADVYEVAEILNRETLKSHACLTVFLP